jgi:hypothetical protein
MAAAEPQVRPRLAVAASVMFLVVNAIQLAAIATFFDGNGCESEDGHACWGEGLAMLLGIALAPFAIYGFAVATTALARTLAGRRLAIPPTWWTAAKVGLWLLGLALALLALAIPGLLLEGRPGTGFLLLPRMVLGSVGPGLAVVGWWTMAVVLTRLAFRRGPRPAA